MAPLIGGIFSVIDIIFALTGSTEPKRCWSDLKRKLGKESGNNETYEKIVRLKMTAEDGKKRLTDTVYTETLFRIIQSIPSPKAEPMKKWLAQVEYERLQEYEDTSLAVERARKYCKKLGRSYLKLHFYLVALLKYFNFNCGNCFYNAAHISSVICFG